MLGDDDSKEETAFWTFLDNLVVSNDEEKEDTGLRLEFEAGSSLACISERGSPSAKFPATFPSVRSGASKAVFPVGIDESRAARWLGAVLRGDRVLTCPDAKENFRFRVFVAAARGLLLSSLLKFHDSHDFIAFFRVAIWKLVQFPQAVNPLSRDSAMLTSFRVIESQACCCKSLVHVQDMAGRSIVFAAWECISRMRTQS